jgi:hypothetical protein
MKIHDAFNEEAVLSEPSLIYKLDGSEHYVFCTGFSTICSFIYLSRMRLWM